MLFPTFNFPFSTFNYAARRFVITLQRYMPVFWANRRDMRVLRAYILLLLGNWRKKIRI